MAISWGAYEGHLRVGIDWTISPANPSHSDTSVTVTWKYYVGANQSFSDTQHLNMNADGVSAWGQDFSNNLSSGGQKLIDTKKVSYPIAYSSGSRGATCNLTGAYNGATPSKSVTINLPDRPKAVPGHPTWLNGADGPWFDSRTQTGFRALLDWASDNGGDAADSMQIQVAKNSNFTGTTWTFSDTTRAVTATGLASGTIYYVRGREHNSVGWSAWSGWHSVGTLSKPVEESTAPGAPTLVSVYGDTPTSEVVSWDEPDDIGGSEITRYTLEISTVSDFSTLWGTYIVNTGDTTAAYVTDLDPSTTYYARVSATNAVGTGPWSGVGSFTTLAPPSTNPPDKPAVPTVSKTTSVTATVSFTPPSSDSPITSYDFQWSTDQTFASGVTTVNVPDSTTSPYVLENLPSSTTLYTRFRASSANGAGAYSDASAAFTTKLGGSDGPLVQKITNWATRVGQDIKSVRSRLTVLEALIAASNLSAGGGTVKIGTIRIAWGTFTASGTNTTWSGTINFPVAFSDVPAVMVGLASNGGGSYMMAGVVSSPTATSFNWEVEWIQNNANTQAWIGSSHSNGGQHSWVAIGPA